MWVDALFGGLAIFAAVLFVGAILIALVMMIKYRSVYWWHDSQPEEKVKGECPVDIDEIIRRMSE